MIRKLCIIMVAAASIFTVSGAVAYDQPALNFGLTSFMDGGPPAGPGFYFEEYLMYYTSDRFNDEAGDDLNLPGLQLDVWLAMSQFIYQSDNELLLGGKWGINVMVPLVSINIDHDLGPLGPQDNGTGLGDILIGPYLQWDPVMGEKGPVFMQRVELAVVLPTGKYDEDKAINPGSNIYSFNPYWAATAWITPRWTVSARLHYLWSSENPDTKVQPGQAFHANFASSYDVLPHQLRLGVNGYYLKQFTDSKLDGDKLSDSREEVFAIGPGAMFSFSQEHHLMFNAYFETMAENRPQGERYILRYVGHF